jgi:hypothetical protein
MASSRDDNAKIYTTIKTGYAAGALGGSRRRTSTHLRYAPHIFLPTARTLPLQPMIGQNAKVRTLGFACPCTKSFEVNAHSHPPLDRALDD